MKKESRLRNGMFLWAGIAILIVGAFFIWRKKQVPVVISLPEPEQILIDKIVSIADTNFHPQRPVWSPNGKWIAFSRAKSDGIEIMNFDGTNRRLLTPDPGSGYKFAWSPDSTEIAYRLSDIQKGIYKIKKADVVSGDTETFAEQKEELQPPEWVVSEKGKRIVFISGTELRSTRWEKMSVAPVWKNADKILYYDQQNIWIMNEDGSGRKQLSVDAGFDPVWSPDRTRIVYSNWDTLTVIDPDGSTKVILGYGNHPSWSPDGKKLVFQVTQDHTHVGEDALRGHTEETIYHRHDDKTNHRIVESDLYLINADGTKRTRLTNTPGIVEVDPSWSPDGRKIVYRIEETGEINVAELKW